MNKAEKRENRRKNRREFWREFLSDQNLVFILPTLGLMIALLMIAIVSNIK